MALEHQLAAALQATVGDGSAQCLRVASGARISRAQAERVAAAFLAAPTRSPDARVGWAYAALARESDVLYRVVVRRLGLRVHFADEPEPYADFADLAADVRAGRLVIASAAATGARRHPLLDNRRGGAYDRFRAVHDVLGHAALGLGFDRHGEYGTWLHQHHHLLRSAGARYALATELHAEHSVLWTTGETAEHKATLLPLDLVRDSLAEVRPGRPGRSPGSSAPRRRTAAGPCSPRPVRGRPPR
jgi:hypothetical protein